MRKVVFYGLPGEGLGHACRTQAILEHCGDEFEIHIFTWGEAYDFFAKQNYPHLHQIAGIPFGRRNGSVDMWLTVCNFFRYLRLSGESIAKVCALAKKHNPALVVSDFEPIVARAAKKLRKPLLSIDNQHKFSRTSDKNLPLDLKLYSSVMGWYSEWTCPYPDFAVVSTFYHSDVKKRHCGKTSLVNCFMRKTVEDAKVSNGDYILVYYKSSVGPKILHELTKTDEKLIVYGCPEANRIRGPEYREISNEGFIKALAECKCVFTSAGNQLLGEAIYMGKPIFAVPEPNQAEQRINAHYVDKMKYGTTSSLESFNADKVRSFLTDFKVRGVKPTNGVYDAIDKIRTFAIQPCQSSSAS